MDKKIEMHAKNCCDWAMKSEIERKYHDNEWGIPVYDDKRLFEFLVLEYMQAGLSWVTILKKREAMRKAFDEFNVNVIANYSDEKIEELMKNPEIIRNRLKLKALVTNAKAFLEVQNEYGSFSDYLWGFIDNKTIINKWKAMSEIPANTDLSDRISKDLKKRGFKFLGSTVIYAYLQSMGLVNDHLVHCEYYK